MGVKGYIDNTKLIRLAQTLRRRGKFDSEDIVGLSREYDQYDNELTRRPIYDSNGNIKYVEDDGNTVMAQGVPDLYIDDYICRIPCIMNPSIASCSLGLSCYGNKNPGNVIVSYVSVYDDGTCQRQNKTVALTENNQVVTNSILKGSLVNIWATDIDFAELSAVSNITDEFCSKEGASFYITTDYGIVTIKSV